MKRGIPTIIKTRIYAIDIFSNDRWLVFDGIQYTLGEVNRKLKELNNNKEFQFRKRFVKTGYLTRVCAIPEEFITLHYGEQGTNKSNV